MQRLLIALALSALCGAAAASTPFRAMTQTNLGTPIVRPGLYDLQPSVLYDTSDPDPAKRFKMWWLGQHPSANPGDRIFYSHSGDGDHWSTPVDVLAPQLGSSGAEAADDHLLGSPTVLKIGSKYYMYYEAYGTWATTVNRFYSFSRGDNWTTNGGPECRDDYCYSVNPDWNPGYTSERIIHGYAPFLRKAGTHPVYAGEVRYAAGQKYNRFVRLTPTPVRTDPNGDAWRQLEGGNPIFWLYDAAAPGRVALYAYWDSIHRNSFTSTNPADPIGVPDYSNGPTHRLGYLASSLDSPDMVGSLQNRIMLATSTDGRNWTRFVGAARGGAVMAPCNELTSFQGRVPHACGSNPLRHEAWDIRRAYGSGFPAATVRGTTLELYFTDDTENFATDQCPGLPAVRARIPLASILSPAAYPSTCNGRDRGAEYGVDIRWSPTLRRYFAAIFDESGKPGIAWSEPNPSTTVPTTFPNRYMINMPPGRRGSAGAIIGNGNGNTLDFTGPPAYTAFHVYHQEYAEGDSPVFGSDIGHTLVFGWHR